MQITNSDKAQVLAEALPYIQDYAGKVVVVKYGGNAMVDGALKAAVMSDIVLLSLVGIKIVLVHGGGPEITETLKAIGKESRFIGGLRYTDEETLKVAQMVLAGKTNKDLVNLLEQQGGRAIGLCGIDGRMISAKKIEGEADLGYVGEVTGVDATVLRDALRPGLHPRHRHPRLRGGRHRLQHQRRFGGLPYRRRAARRKPHLHDRRARTAPQQGTTKTR